MKIIEKKIWPDMFNNDKEMPIVFRLADFELEEGNAIRFREWTPETKQYTGREFIKTVKKITKHNSPTRYWKKEELEEKGMYIIEFE